MSNEQLQRVMVDHFNLRIRDEMTQYVQQRLLSRDGETIPVIGGDARTGVAVRKIVARSALRRAAGEEA